MPLTLRGDGTGAAFLVNSTWWNDYYNLLTGVMTDQPVSLYYAPGSSGSTPVLKLRSNNNADLLQGYDGSNTKVFTLDKSGNLSGNTITALPASGSHGVLITYATVPTGSLGFRVAVTGDSGPRAGLLIRNDGYGLLQLGNNVNTYQFWGANDGLHTNAALTVSNNFTMTGNATLGRITSDGGTVTTDGSGKLTVASFASSGLATITRTLSGAIKEFVRMATTDSNTYGMVVDTDGAWKLRNIGTSANLLSVDASGGMILTGDLTGPIGGGIPTTRNGAAVSARIFTGTTTPTSPRDGDIWIKA